MAVDLKDDPALIAEYERYHEKVWPEILQSLYDSGIEAAEIYRTGTRLVMIIETNESFSFEKKAIADAENDKVQEWEKLMWKYQQPVPWARPGVKWTVMHRVFELGKKETGDLKTGDRILETGEKAVNSKQ